jgi:hypothetical protein
MHVPRREQPIKTWKQNLYEICLVRSWWVHLFLGACYVVYSHGMHKKNLVISHLHNRLVDLEKERELVFEAQEDLMLQVKSQSDPAWVQMILMKELGLVPVGHTKVYFKQEE